MDKNIYSSEFKWAVVKGKNKAILTLTERKTHKEILVKIDDKNLKTLWSSFSSVSDVPITYAEKWCN